MKLLRTFVVAMVVVFSMCQSSQAYNPESPEVQAILKKAVGFLKTEGSRNNKLGGHALRGMAILKATHDPKDAAVLEEVAYVSRVGKLPVERLRELEPAQYSLGIAVMFLASYDKVKYKPEISNFLAALHANQRQDGGWSYVQMGEEPSGDTSQTQYGAMASWVALKSVKLQAKPRVYEKALVWLIQKQNANGSFAYKPDAQSENHTSISLTAAGAASAMICADALGLLDKSKSIQNSGGLQRVTPKGGEAGPVSAGITRAAVMTTVGRANNYFNSNFSWKKTDSFYYFMYAMERYKTFKDMAAGNPDAKYGEDEPAWYNEGVEVLKKQQASDGSFNSINGKQVATSFAILFLVRSTKATFETAVEGLVRGGYGLPKDVSTLREGEDGEVIGTEIKGALYDVLALLEQDDDTDYEMLLAKLKDVKIPKVDARQRDAQMEKLRKRISSPKFGERLVAVRAMAGENSLDVAPGLIYALTDPDSRIAIEARNGLRFIARRFDGFGMPNEPNDAQKKIAQDAWKKWLRSIRPNAKFILQ